MMVVKEIKATYFGAEILYRLFTKALDVTNSRRRTLEATTPSEEDGRSVAIPEDREDHEREPTRSAWPTILTPNTVSNGGDAIVTRYLFPYMLFVNGTQLTNA